MRWRVGRRPTSRNMALTSCQGQPVRSARGLASCSEDCGTNLDTTVGRGCIIETLHLFLLIPSARTRDRCVCNHIRCRGLFATASQLPFLPVYKVTPFCP